MTDTDMNATYKASLEEARRELAGMDERRAALQATIAGLERLLQDNGQTILGPELAREPSSHSAKTLKIPPQFFKGKSPTQAYRDLMQLWPGDYSPPEIRDAFVEGGMEGRTKTQLLVSVHSILRRKKQKEEKEQAE